jgi:four helix bundle protein
MPRTDLERRTRTFAVSVIRFVDNLPKGRAIAVVAIQLIRSATSIGANYREAHHAESRRDFVHKIAISEKESAESLYWLEILDEMKLGDPIQRGELICECDQLVAIFTRIGQKSKQSSPTSAFRLPPSDFPE